jgi:hypothetical protein
MRHGSPPLRERRSTRPEELHTAGARVVVLDVQDTRFDSPEAYLRFVEDEAKRGSTGRRFRRIETQYAIEPEGPAPLCVRYETVVEDSQVPGFPSAVFVLAARGLRCVHPHSSQSTSARPAASLRVFALHQKPIAACLRSCVVRYFRRLARPGAATDAMDRRRSSLRRV